MLDRIQKLAQLLAPLRPAFWLLALAALSGLVYLLLGESRPQADAWLLPLTVALAWVLSLEALVLCFAAVPSVEPNQGWLRRIWRRLQRGFAALVALIFLGLMLVLGWVSLRSVVMLT